MPDRVALRHRGDERRESSPAGVQGLDPSRFACSVFDPLEPSSNYAAWRQEDSAPPFFREGEDGVRVAEPMSRASCSALAEVARRAPHMSALWGELFPMVEAAAVAGVPLVLDPLLVLGPPGVGKTWAVNRIVAALGLEGGILSMAGTSLNEGIQGSHPSWRGAGPGFVAKTFAGSSSPNPMICVDEFDKAGAHANRADPYAPYLALLEPEGATTFVDEYLGIHFMTGMVSWLFTANDARSMPDLVVDRLRVVEVAAPDRDQARVILREMLVDAHARYGEFLAPDVSDDVLDALSGLTPRRARLAYSSGMARAVASGRGRVGVGDLPSERRVAALGFVGR